MTPDSYATYNLGVALARWAYRTDPFAGSRLIALGQIKGWRSNQRITAEDFAATFTEIQGWVA